MSRTGYDLTMGYAIIALLPKGTERAVQYAVYGLLSDGGHSKQWCLERVLESLGVNMAHLDADLKDAGYVFEEGIAP